MESEENLLKSSMLPLFKRAWHLKWLLIPMAIISIVSAVYYTRQQTKIYRAATQIIIDLEAPRYLPYSGQEVVRLGTTNSWNTVEFFETQFRIIQSLKVSESVALQEKLIEDHDFLGVDQIEPEKRAEFLSEVNPAAILRSRVSVVAVPDSHVVEIRVTDHKPQRAARLANAIAEAYRLQNVGHKVSAAQEAVRWLSNKVDEISDQRKRSDEAMLHFKQENDLLQSTLAERQHLLGLTIQSIEKDLLDASQEVKVLRAEARQLKRATSSQAELSIPQVISNPLIQRLKEQRLTLENQRTELLEQYLEAHPKVKVVSDQLERINKTIQGEVKGIKSSISRQLQAAEFKETSLKETLKGLKEKARGIQAQELTFKALEANVKSNATLSEQMQVRLKEAELQAQTTANNVRLLEGALSPTIPIFPRLSRNLLISLFGWSVLSFLVLLLFDLMDRSLKTQLQFAELYKLTPLGSLPLIERGKRPQKNEAVVRQSELYVMENPQSTIAECVRTIRTNFLFMNPNRTLKSLLITSAAPKEGKTLTSISIASSLAMAGDRVLLVDCDLRRPRVHKVFGMVNDRGLTNMLVDPDVESEEVSRPTPLENLDIMTSGALIPNPAEILQTPAFERTLQKLLGDYDRVIFDSPPVVPVTDSQIIGRQVDGTMLVARSEVTNKDVFNRALELLRAVNVNLLGGLMNGVDMSKELYGQYYYQYTQNPADLDPLERQIDSE